MSSETKPSIFRRVAERIVTLTVTLAVVGGAGAAVLLGSNLLAERAAANQPTDIAELTKVSVTPLTVETGYTVPRRFAGQIESGASVDMSFELSGRLIEIEVDEGEAVDRGQTIARLDTAILEAEQTRLQSSRASAEARLTLATSQLERTTRLYDRDHTSAAALDQAQATYDELVSTIAEIDAALASVSINLDKSTIRAPFSGQIGSRLVDAGTTLSAGQPVLTVIETAAPRLRVGLPLSVEPSALTNAQIEIGGERIPAKLVQLRPDIDPVTRTRTALFELATDQVPAFGATASLVVTTPVAQPGTWVPIDALQEGTRGFWTVLVVDEDVVRNASVELLYAEETRAFVRGTFEPGAQLIDRGAHRVVPGQTVEIIGAEG
ncbi:MAG: efflux RND transporter periplasmic adaptor subunit [Pseudomonadota bacterium]